MKIIEILKKELTGWKKIELVILIGIIFIIAINVVVLKDSVVAVLSAICGITYTMFAGKGKVSCYFFGLCGSGCYSYLSLINGLYGNLALYLCYYIPSQILGFFSWKKNLKTTSQEIYKKSLSDRQKFVLFLVGVLGSIVSILLLYKLNDKSPVMDGITTFLSILGMYLTVKRCIEQWIIWAIVNGLSFLMWLIIIADGAKAYSTLFMWFTYFMLAFYFYKEWKKELDVEYNNKSCRKVKHML